MHPQGTKDFEHKGGPSTQRPYKSSLEQGKGRAEPRLSAQRLRPQRPEEMGAGSVWKGCTLVPAGGLGN